jgi:hypothetical protein
MADVIPIVNSPRMSWMLLSSVLLLILLDATEAVRWTSVASTGSPFSPVALGVRSAWVGSGWRVRSSASSSRQGSPSRVLSVAYERHADEGDESEEEQRAVENAYWRPATEADAYRLRHATHAYLQRPKYQSETELDHLEALTIPCAARANPSPSHTFPPSDHRGGAAAAVASRPLLFWETMICGATSRSIAQTIMHPANTMKTILQNARRGPAAPTIVQLARPENFRRLTRGAGANFLLSLPHGAVNFAVLELVRSKLGNVVAASPGLADNAAKLGPGLDFLSSCISTVTCSVVSTPQMMITDNIMAGNYPNLGAAIRGLYRERGVLAFYRGWWPGLVGKIPSYALTWTFFQQLKTARDRLSDRPASDIENSAMGCLASATTVCIMIPMDTIKTRLVTQTTGVGAELAYKGIVDCAIRVFREEGIGTFYRGLPPRLVSVVPMIGIQFGVYEAMKKVMLRRNSDLHYNGTQRATVPSARGGKRNTAAAVEEYGRLQILEEAAMEVAASPEHPYPAPQFLNRVHEPKKKTKKQALRRQTK